jgi:hypothetical protein
MLPRFHPFLRGSSLRLWLVSLRWLTRLRNRGIGRDKVPPLGPHPQRHFFIVRAAIARLEYGINGR